MLSEYQQNFINEIQNPNGANIVVVNAKAGSGKTFTLCEGAKSMKGSTAFFAFNKAIAEELKGRGLNAMTMHSLGMKACSALGKVRINNYKGTDLCTRLGIEKKDMQSFKRLNSLGRAHLLAASAPQTQWAELVEHFEVPLSEKQIAAGFWSKFAEFYSAMFATNNGIDFDDMVSLPIFNDFDIPKFDWVLVDEAQDLNPNRMELIFRAMKGRAVFVGDPNQAIYGFTGAMCNSMDEIVNRATTEQRSVVTLPLSICYRCPVAVIKEAQTIVPEIEAAPEAIEGCVSSKSMDDFRKDVQAGNYVICRTIAPLVKTCFELIRNGRRAMVKGREIGTDLVNMVERIASRGTVSVVKFIPELQAYQTREVEKQMEANREMQAEAINDKCDTLLVLCENVETVYDLKSKIEGIFADDIPANTIMFSSVHRVKGLQSRTVWVLRGDLMPHPKCKKDWQVQQEMNLKYVALTRSEENLYYVESDEKK